MSQAASFVRSLTWDNERSYFGADATNPREALGVGEGVDTVRRVFEELTGARFPATTYNIESAAKKFDRLASKWREATLYSSVPEVFLMHPSYQEIIGMGQAAVPFLLRELRDNPDHWFLALRSITHINPVDPDAAGDIPAMARAWVAWGEERGIDF